MGTGTSILTPPFHYCHLLSELSTNNADFYSYFHLHSHTIQIRYHLLFSDHHFTPYNSMNAEDLCFNRDYPTLPSRAESPPWRIYRCETFKTMDSGAKQVSIRMVPNPIPKNQHPEFIPKPLEFPGIDHLFPKDLERLLCPVRVLGLDLRNERKKIHNKNFLCISPPRHPAIHYPLQTLGS